MSATMAARARTGASLSAPVRRAQPARRKSPSWFAQIFRTASRRPGRALLFLAFGLVSLAIVANALMLQKARHPHPMLSRPMQVEEARPASAARRAEPATAPATAPPMDIPSLLAPALPPSRPNDLSQAGPATREAAPRPPATIANVARAPAPAVAPAPRAAAPRDPIADLINGGDLRPPAEIRGVATRAAAAPRRTASN